MRVIVASKKGGHATRRRGAQIRLAYLHKNEKVIRTVPILTLNST